MYEMIVVGMGAAGCMACAVMQHFEKNVLALEAMDRLGGRVHTAPFGDCSVELGAEWVHGTVGNSVYNIARTERKKLVQQDLHFNMFTSDGIDGNAQLLTELLKYAFSILEHPPTEPQPLGQFISEKVREYLERNHPQQDTAFVESFLRWMDLVIRNHESCSHWDNVSTQTKYEELEGSLLMSWHKLGYKTVMDLMLNTHKMGCKSLDLKLNTEVVHVKIPLDTDDLVEVTCKDGSVYHSRAAIITLSLGVLKERHSALFSPPLPEKKVKAIEDISIGVVGKVIFLFDDIWWPTNTSCFAFIWRTLDLEAVPHEDKWITMIFGASLSMSNEKCLVFWTSGNYAKMIETLPEGEVWSKLMGLLRMFMGKQYVIPEPVEMIRSDWYSNPFTRGSYSFDDILTPEHPNARADLAEPILDQQGNVRVMFAGEATDVTHFSTVHGAIDSGRREGIRYVKTDRNCMPVEGEQLF